MTAKLDAINNSMYGQIVILETVSHHINTARVSGIIEPDWVELTMFSGKKILVNVDEIKYMAPVRNQPKTVI